MTMFALNDYQQKALAALDGFFCDRRESLWDKLRASDLPTAWQACAPTNEKSGQAWQSSGGYCLFLLAVAEDEQGRNVEQQIGQKLLRP